MAKYDLLTGNIINSLHDIKQFVKENEPDLLSRVETIYDDYTEFDEIMSYGRLEHDAGGYVEAIGPDLFYAVELLEQVWNNWKQGPETEQEMIKYAKKDILNYIASKLK